MRGTALDGAAGGAEASLVSATKGTPGDEACSPFARWAYRVASGVFRVGARSNESRSEDADRECPVRHRVGLCATGATLTEAVTDWYGWSRKAPAVAQASAAGHLPLGVARQSREVDKSFSRARFFPPRLMHLGFRSGYMTCRAAMTAGHRVTSAGSSPSFATGPPGFGTAGRTLLVVGSGCGSRHAEQCGLDSSRYVYSRRVTKCRQYAIDGCRVRQQRCEGFGVCQK